MPIIFAASPTIAILARFSLVLAISLTWASAVEDTYRLVPQLSVGTSGFEPGVALEWRSTRFSSVIVRPEVFLSDGRHPGAGGAVLYDFSHDLALPLRHAIAAGPRAVYHNSDDRSWEAGGLGTYSYDLSSGPKSWRHSVGALAALGVIQENHPDEMTVGLTLGAFYAFGF